MQWLWLIPLAVWLVSIRCGCYVAEQKSRSLNEGFWFALLFGPLGVLIVACLPNNPDDVSAWKGLNRLVYEDVKRR